MRAAGTSSSATALLGYRPPGFLSQRDLAKRAHLRTAVHIDGVRRRCADLAPSSLHGSSVVLPGGGCCSLRQLAGVRESFSTGHYPSRLEHSKKRATLSNDVRICKSQSEYEHSRTGLKSSSPVYATQRPAPAVHAHRLRPWSQVVLRLEDAQQEAQRHTRGETGLEGVRARGVRRGCTSAPARVQGASGVLDAALAKKRPTARRVF